MQVAVALVALPAVALLLAVVTRLEDGLKAQAGSAATAAAAVPAAVAEIVSQAVPAAGAPDRAPDGAVLRLAPPVRPALPAARHEVAEAVQRVA